MVGPLTGVGLGVDAHEMSSLANKHVSLPWLIFLAGSGAVVIALVLNACLAAPPTPSVRSAATTPVTAAAQPPVVQPSVAPASLAPATPATDVAVPASEDAITTVPHYKTKQAASHKRAATKRAAKPVVVHRAGRSARRHRSADATTDASVIGTPAEISWTGRDGKKWRPGDALDESRFPNAKPLVPANAKVIRTVIHTAAAQNGTPYVWGGNTPGSFDCSGLVQYAYAQAGVTIPRTTYAQWGAIPHVKNPADLMPGDIVFFENLGHEALYVGNDYVMEAPHTGAVVRGIPLSIISEKDGYVGAVRPSSLHA